MLILYKKYSTGCQNVVRIFLLLHLFERTVAWNFFKLPSLFLSFDSFKSQRDQESRPTSIEKHDIVIFFFKIY
jgi:hypothetical protein